jgi:flagellar hook-length control protein FliK
MLINGSLPVLPPSHSPSSSLSLQQTSESGGGDFSALLFLIFANPNPQAVANGIEGQLAATESSATDDGALIAENDADKAQIVSADLLQLSSAERISELSASNEGVIGLLGSMLPEQAANTATEATAGSSGPLLARLNGQLSALAHSSDASNVQQCSALPPLASGGPTPDGGSESALLSIKQTSSEEQPSATQMFASLAASKEPTGIYSFPRPPAHLGAGSEEPYAPNPVPQNNAGTTVELTSDSRNDIANKLSNGEQPFANLALNQKMAPLTQEKTSELSKILPPSSRELSANNSLSTVNVAAKSGASVAPDYGLAKQTQSEGMGERSMDRSLSESFPNDAFKNGQDRSETSNPSSYFSALSPRATENGVAGDAKPNASWSPMIDHVAAEIAGNVRQNKHEAVITLDPPELGKLKIDLMVDGNKVQVRIFAAARESQGLIENHLHDLKQALVFHRLDLVDVRVDGGSWNGAAGDLTHGFQQHPDGQPEPGWRAGNSPQGTSEVVDASPGGAVREKGRVSIRA